MPIFKSNLLRTDSPSANDDCNNEEDGEAYHFDSSVDSLGYESS